MFFGSDTPFMGADSATSNMTAWVIFFHYNNVSLSVSYSTNMTWDTKWDPLETKMHRGNTTPRVANTHMRLGRVVNASGNRIHGGAKRPQTAGERGREGGGGGV